MKRALIATTALLLCFAVTGCARAARDASAFTITDEGTIDAPFEETWQAAKAALREMEMDIYTRDKRGVFIAYSQASRKLTVPHRTQYTIVLEEASATTTTIRIDTVEQVYGVTLLTYPNWHDRPADDHAKALEILEAVKAKIAAA